MYRVPTQHRMTRRAVAHNYSAPGVYHITLHVADGLGQPFGAVVGNLNVPDGSADAPRIALTPVGKMVEQELLTAMCPRHPRWPSSIRNNITLSKEYYHKMRHMSILKTCIIFLMLFVRLTNIVASDTSYEVLPDSSNFVHASVLIASPGKELFFVLGHSALRLQCPSEKLDYCFSFNTVVDQGMLFDAMLLTGQMKAGYEALKFDDYIKPFRESGRGVKEYPLNLTLQEERELWKLMDNYMMKGLSFKFDFLFNNCTAPLFRSLESIMQRESFIYTDEYPLTMSTRERMRISLNEPWFDFFSVIMLSAYYRDEFPLYMKVYPELWGRLLTKADIVGLDGSRRPALESPVKELLPQHLYIKRSSITPTVFFGFFLALILLVTLLEDYKVLLKLPKLLDKGLFVIYNFFSLYLLYASCIQLFGTFVNWFLIVFNILPFFAWLFFRKKKTYLNFWGTFIAVLIAFMIFLPFYMGNMEWPHEFLLATLLTRCIAKYKHLKLSLI